MVITNVMVSAALIIISFTISFVIFYIYSDLKREKKWKLIQEIISQLINFIFFIWVAKILLNFSLFIKAPLTLLAYPSDSYTFYIAFIINSVLFIYINRKKRLDTTDFLEAFTIVFLTSSIIYELIDFLSNNNDRTLVYLLLLAFVLLAFLILQGRLKPKTLLTLSSFLWSFGILLLLNFYSVITIFGYILRLWFLPIFFVVSTLLIFLTMKEEDKQ